MSEFSRISMSNNLPKWMFERMGGQSRPEGLEQTCNSCGRAVSPIKCVNGWVPGKCSCQNINEEHFRKTVQKNRREDEKFARKSSCTRCYTWLGEYLENLQEKTFEGYQPEKFFNAYNSLYQFASADEPLPWVNLILYGNSGTGKTHLLAAALNYICRRDIPCRFATGQGLFDAISACMAFQRDYSHIVNEAGKIPVLALDDIDKIWIRDQEESFQMTVLFSIINKRYLHRLPTVITTNAIDITPYVGAAGFSRLKDHGRLIAMIGGDFRDRTFLM